MIKIFVNKILGFFDLIVINKKISKLNVEKIKNYERLTEYIKLITKFHGEVRLLGLVELARSQLGQDLFVLKELNFKRNGYFVEFGATNGIIFSNTYLLEKEFGWHGILAEPAKCWHEELMENRSVHIETNCVWSDSFSILNFIEADVAELSTIDSFSSSDLHEKRRKEGQTYQVKTISLLDLLEKYKSPRLIDFLSIDTEGSEFNILKNFDFDRYKFNVIACEHNFTSAREEIFSLLTNNGYMRKFEDISQFDDWYVRVK